MAVRVVAGRLLDVLGKPAPCLRHSQKQVLLGGIACLTGEAKAFCRVMPILLGLPHVLPLHRFLIANGAASDLFP
jgi:hypothetical protein